MIADVDGGNGMVIFKLITDMVSNAGILWFTWELVRVARFISAPRPDEVKLILGGLRRVELVIEKLSFELAHVAGVENSQQPEHCGEN